MVLYQSQGAGGVFFLHVKLMFYIMCEELIRDGDRAHTGSFSVFKQTQLSIPLIDKHSITLFAIEK